MSYYNQQGQNPQFAPQGQNPQYGWNPQANQQQQANRKLLSLLLLIPSFNNKVWLLWNFFVKWPACLRYSKNWSKHSNFIIGDGYQSYQSVPAFQGGNPSYMESGEPKMDLNFNDQTIRAAFVRKVFSLVTIMLGVVAVMVSWIFNDIINFLV
jgi:hypothetical protein